MHRRFQIITSAVIATYCLVHLFPQFQAFYRITKINQQRITEVVDDKPMSADSLRLAPDRTGVFLCYGQSNAGNFGEKVGNAYSEVYQVCRDELFPFSTPSCGSGGNGGNPWGIMGQRLIENRLYDQVIIANAAVGGASIEQLSSETYLDFFFLQHHRLLKIAGHVDAILMLQGEADYGNSDNYQRAFDKLMHQLNRHGIFTPIILSQTTICRSHLQDVDLAKVQRNLSKQNSQILEGPDTDRINFSGARYDYCHFTKAGLDSLGKAWAECLAFHLKTSLLP